MKHTLLRSLALATIALSSAGLQASMLSPQAALERFLNSNEKSAKRLAPRNSENLTLAFTGYAHKQAVGYVFTSDKGNEFYLLAADDTKPAMLGYGTNFTADNLPPAFSWWLSLVAESDGTADVADHPAIAPLVKTIWGQSAPFYNMCPEQNGKHSVTGCMATSVAQVVNYHRLPAAKGFGTASYIWDNQTLSFDYSSTPFDWDNMLDSYNGEYTDVQANAVAQLMLAIGIGEHMNYSPSESGASSVFISPLLYEHLGFDKGVALMRREYFSAVDWDEMMYAELAAGRPIVYSGQATDGGHSFVCDGYDANGYYHINWGWQSDNDGYFLLSALNPTTQGIGGYEGGYNSHQDAEIGIQPPVEGSEIFLPLYATGGFAYNSTYGGYGFGDDGGYLNYSSAPMTFTPGLKLVAQTTRADEGEEYYVAGKPVTFAGASDDGKLTGHIYYATAPLFSLNPGTYEAYPVAKADGSDNWQKIYVPAADNQSITVRIGNNGVVTYDGSDPDAVNVTTTVTDVKQPTPWTPDEPGIIETTFSNTSSETQTLSLSFNFTNEQTGEYYTIGIWTVPVDPGTVTYNLNFNVDMPKGIYTAYAMNGDNKISDSYTLYVDMETEVASLIGSAEVRYFNLQGMQVSNPQKGCLYIATQGNKVRKVVF